MASSRAWPCEGGGCTPVAQRWHGGRVSALPNEDDCTPLRTRPQYRGNPTAVPSGPCRSTWATRLDFPSSRLKSAPGRLQSTPDTTVVPMGPESGPLPTRLEPVLGRLRSPPDPTAVRAEPTSVRREPDCCTHGGRLELTAEPKSVPSRLQSGRIRLAPPARATSLTPHCAPTAPFSTRPAPTSKDVARVSAAHPGARRDSPRCARRPLPRLRLLFLR